MIPSSKYSLGCFCSNEVKKRSPIRKLLPRPKPKEPIHIPFQLHQPMLQNKIILGDTSRRFGFCYADANTFHNMAVIGGVEGGKERCFIMPYIITAISRGEHIVIFDPEGNLKSQLDPILTDIPDYQVCQYTIARAIENEKDNLLNSFTLDQLTEQLTTQTATKLICFIKTPLRYKRKDELQVAQTVTALMKNILTVARTMEASQLPIPISFCIDEGAYIGWHPILLDALKASKELGLRIILSLENISLLKQKTSNWSLILDSFHLLIYRGNTDAFTVNYLCENYQVKYKNQLSEKYCANTTVLAHGRKAQHVSAFNYDDVVDYLSKHGLIPMNFYNVFHSAKVHPAPPSIKEIVKELSNMFFIPEEKKQELSEGGLFDYLTDEILAGNIDAEEKEFIFQFLLLYLENNLDAERMQSMLTDLNRVLTDRMKAND